MQIYLMGWGVYFINYCCRYNYSASMVIIGQTEEIDVTQLGFVASVLFVTYGSGQLISGWLGDRFNPKIMIFCGTMGAAISNIIMSLSDNVLTMELAWGINGLCCSFLWAPMVRLLTLYMPEDLLNKAILSFSYCSALGITATYLLTAWLNSYFSWRVCFWVPAIISALSAAGWLLVSLTSGPVPKSISNVLTSAIQNELKQSPLKIYCKSGLPLIFIMIVIMGVLKDGIMTWLPQIITDTLKINAEDSIAISAVLPLTHVISVWAIKWLYKHKKDNDMLNSGILFVSSGLCMLIVVFSGTYFPVLNIILYLLISTLVNGISVMLINSVPLQYARFGRVSTLAGITNTFTYVGSSLSSYGLGFIAQNYSWSFANGALALCCFLGLLFSLLANPLWRNFIQVKKAPETMRQQKSGADQVERDSVWKDHYHMN